MTPIYLLNGWGMNQHVLAPLQQALKIPEQQLLCMRDYIAKDLAHSLQHLRARIPAQAIVIGWSLGGMLALQLALSHPLRAVITLGSNRQFIAQPDWPEAMPLATFRAFSSSLLSQPERTLHHFLRLCTQGDRALRQLGTQWIDTQLTIQDLQVGLDYLAQINNATPLRATHPLQLHFYATQDALVPISSMQSLKQHYPHHTYHSVPAGHAMVYSHAQTLAASITQWIHQHAL